MPSDDTLVRIGEAAQILGVSEATVRRIPEGDLAPVLRIGGRGDRRYRRTDVVALRDKWRGGNIDALQRMAQSVTDPADRARAVLRFLENPAVEIPNADELRERAQDELRDLGETPD